MPLFNCEINLILSWFENRIVSNTVACQSITFAIIDTKLHVLVVTLSTQVDVRLLHQLKSGLKRAINCNKYKSKVTTPALKRHLNYLLETEFKGVNRLFLLTFDINANRLEL